MTQPARELEILDTAATRARISAALKSTASPQISFPEERDCRSSIPALPVRLPPWVARYGRIEADESLWLWCEPRPGKRPRYLDQLVVEVPSGRYTVEILDTAAGTWFSRESGEGGPLVAGLPFTGHPILVLIRHYPG